MLIIWLSHFKGTFLKFSLHSWSFASTRKRNDTLCKGNLNVKTFIPPSKIWFFFQWRSSYLLLLPFIHICHSVHDSVHSTLTLPHYFAQFCSYIFLLLVCFNHIRQLLMYFFLFIKSNFSSEILRRKIKESQSVKARKKIKKKRELEI